ncbi:MAG: 50S ribosome-binding GTPase, partial [Myxococcales bacterium]|nr:50S ribosome-binding GTPase [Myxococcales bacterium]
ESEVDTEADIEAEGEDEPRRTRRPWRRGDDPTGPIRVAFVGKPNAGKSSLTNRLLGEERSLVHHEPGTTTDPVDTPLTFAGQDYVLVDTAGIRRKARIDEDVEKLAVTLALAQIERADVVVLVIDAALGPSEQDARLAGAIEQAGRGLIIAFNKADLLRGEAAQERLRQAVKDTFHFLTWAPVTTLSAQRGDGVDRLMDLAKKVAAQHRRRITTSELNRFFAEVCETVPPPVWRGRSVRVYFLTQAAVRPPTFILKASAPDGVSPQYRRFLANQLRRRYGFRGTPLRVFTRARDDKKPT